MAEEYRYLHVGVEHDCPAYAKELTFNITYKNESSRDLHIEIRIYEFGTENEVIKLSKDVKANSEATDTFTFTPPKLPFMMAFDIKTNGRLDTFLHEVREPPEPCQPTETGEIPKINVGFGIPIEKSD